MTKEDFLSHIAGTLPMAFTIEHMQLHYKQHGEAKSVGLYIVTDKDGKVICAIPDAMKLPTPTEH